MSETVDRGNDKRVAPDLPIRLLPSAQEGSQAKVDVRLGVGTRRVNECG